MLSSYYQGASLKSTVLMKPEKLVLRLTWNLVPFLNFLDLAPKFVLMRIWTPLSGSSDTLNFLASLIRLC